MKLNSMNSFLTIAKIFNFFFLSATTTLHETSKKIVEHENSARSSKNTTQYQKQTDLKNDEVNGFCDRVVSANKTLPGVHDKCSIADIKDNVEVKDEKVKSKKNKEREKYSLIRNKQSEDRTRDTYVFETEKENFGARGNETSHRDFSGFESNFFYDMGEASKESSTLLVDQMFTVISGEKDTKTKESIICSENISSHENQPVLEEGSCINYEDGSLQENIYGEFPPQNLTTSENLLSAIPFSHIEPTPQHLEYTPAYSQDNMSTTYYPPNPQFSYYDVNRSNSSQEIPLGTMIPIVPVISVIHVAATPDVVNYYGALLKNAETTIGILRNENHELNRRINESSYVVSGDNSENFRHVEPSINVEISPTLSAMYDEGIETNSFDSCNEQNSQIYGPLYMNLLVDPENKNIPLDSCNSSTSQSQQQSSLKTIMNSNFLPQNSKLEEKELCCSRIKENEIEDFSSSDDFIEIIIQPTEQKKDRDFPTTNHLKSNLGEKQRKHEEIRIENISTGVSLEHNLYENEAYPENYNGTAVVNSFGYKFDDQTKLKESQEQRVEHDDAFSSLKSLEESQIFCSNQPNTKFGNTHQSLDKTRDEADNKGMRFAEKETIKSNEHMKPDKRDSIENSLDYDNGLKSNPKTNNDAEVELFKNNPSDIIQNTSGCSIKKDKSSPVLRNKHVEKGIKDISDNLKAKEDDKNIGKNGIGTRTLKKSSNSYALPNFSCCVEEKLKLNDQNFPTLPFVVETQKQLGSLFESSNLKEYEIASNNNNNSSNCTTKRGNVPPKSDDITVNDSLKHFAPDIYAITNAGNPLSENFSPLRRKHVVDDEEYEKKIDPEDRLTNSLISSQRQVQKSKIYINSAQKSKSRSRIGPQYTYNDFQKLDKKKVFYSEKLIPQVNASSRLPKVKIDNKQNPFTEQTSSDSRKKEIEIHEEVKDEKNSLPDQSRGRNEKTQFILKEKEGLNANSSKEKDGSNILEIKTTADICTEQQNQTLFEDSKTPVISKFREDVRTVVYDVIKLAPENENNPHSNNSQITDNTLLADLNTFKNERVGKKFEDSTVHNKDRKFRNLKKVIVSNEQQMEESNQNNTEASPLANNSKAKFKKKLRGKHNNNSQTKKIHPPIENVIITEKNPGEKEAQVNNKNSGQDLVIIDTLEISQNAESKFTAQKETSPEKNAQQAKKSLSKTIELEGTSHQKQNMKLLNQVNETTDFATASSVNGVMGTRGVNQPTNLLIENTILLDKKFKYFITVYLTTSDPQVFIIELDDPTLLAKICYIGLCGYIFEKDRSLHLYKNINELTINSSENSTYLNRNIKKFIKAKGMSSTERTKFFDVLCKTAEISEMIARIPIKKKMMSSYISKVLENFIDLIENYHPETRLYLSMEFLVINITAMIL